MAPHLSAMKSCSSRHLLALVPTLFPAQPGRDIRGGQHKAPCPASPVFNFLSLLLSSFPLSAVAGQAGRLTPPLLPPFSAVLACALSHSAPRFTVFLRPPSVSLTVGLVQILGLYIHSRRADTDRESVHARLSHQTSLLSFLTHL